MEKDREKKRKEDKKLEHCWTQHKKKQKTNIFLKNRQCIDWTKEKPNICLNFVNFNCGHIINIVFTCSEWLKN